MNGTITAIYEQGVLRPLTTLSLPEHTRVQIQIIKEHLLPLKKIASRYARP